MTMMAVLMLPWGAFADETRPSARVPLAHVALSAPATDAASAVESGGLRCRTGALPGGTCFAAIVPETRQTLPPRQPDGGDRFTAPFPSSAQRERPQPDPRPPRVF